MPSPSENAPSLGGVQVVRQRRLGVARLHRSGARPYRLLAIGNRSLLAPSGAVQTEMLGERIADRVWLQTRRGVDLDLVWEPQPALQAMKRGISSWRLWRYDAVVVFVTYQRAGLAARWRARALATLLDEVIEAAAATSHVLVVSASDQDAPTGSGQTGKKRSTRSRVGDPECTVPVRVSRLTTTLNAKAAADAVAKHLAEPLAIADRVADTPTDPIHQQRARPDEEERRQQALDELNLRTRQVTRRLQQVVDMARETFGSASAELSVMDRDERWVMAVSGLPSRDRSRQGSLCNDAIQRRDPTVIGDTWAIPALRGNALQAGADPVRFYAAYPIESIEGYRIGVLCVWDDAPHNVDGVDVSTLRDLALLAEAELITADRALR